MRVKEWAEELHKGCLGPCCNQVLDYETIQLIRNKGLQTNKRVVLLPTVKQKVEHWILNSVEDEKERPC